MNTYKVALLIPALLIASCSMRNVTEPSKRIQASAAIARPNSPSGHEIPRHRLSNENTVLCITGKKPTGFMRCISPDGTLLWEVKGRMWVVGIDKSDNILVNGGHPRAGGYYSRLFSPQGGLLWHHRGEGAEHIDTVEALETDKNGMYIIPKTKDH